MSPVMATDIGRRLSYRARLHLAGTKAGNVLDFSDNLSLPSAGAEAAMTRLGRGPPSRGLRPAVV